MTSTGAISFFQSLDYPKIALDKRPIIITDNLKTPENIGHILRLAGNIGCRQVFAVNDGELPRKSKINSVAQVSGYVVDWQFCSTHELLKLIPQDYTLVALETMHGSQNIFESKLPQKMALMVGNEIVGISKPLLDAANMCVHIPVPGTVKSFNVAQATGVCLFEWVRRQLINAQDLE